MGHIMSGSIFKYIIFKLDMFIINEDCEKEVQIMNIKHHPEINNIYNNFKKVNKRKNIVDDLTS